MKILLIRYYGFYCHIFIRMTPFFNTGLISTSSLLSGRMQTQTLERTKAVMENFMSHTPTECVAVLSIFRFLLPFPLKRTTFLNEKSVRKWMKWNGIIFLLNFFFALHTFITYPSCFSLWHTNVITSTYWKSLVMAWHIVLWQKKCGNIIQDIYHCEKQYECGVFGLLLFLVVSTTTKTDSFLMLFLTWPWWLQSCDANKSLAFAHV